MSEFALTAAIVDASRQKAVRRALARAGASGATWIYGRGTASGGLLALLGLDSLRRALVLVVHPADQGPALRQTLDKELGLSGRGHGVALGLPVRDLCGLAGVDCTTIKEEKNMEDQSLIVVIVNNGRGEDVVDAAAAAGGAGATILRGRGSGAENKEHFYNFVIEPEKEIVLLATRDDKKAAIIEAIGAVIDFQAPNTGILFSLPLTDSLGLAQAK